MSQYHNRLNLSGFSSSNNGLVLVRRQGQYFAEEIVTFQFLDLPYDVRYKIYTELLVSKEPISPTKEDYSIGRRLYRSMSFSRRALTPAICRTNHQIAEESIRILYSQNIFSFDSIDIPAPFALHFASYLHLIEQIEFHAFKAGDAYLPTGFQDASFPAPNRGTITQGSVEIDLINTLFAPFDRLFFPNLRLLRVSLAQANGDPPLTIYSRAVDNLIDMILPPKAKLEIVDCGSAMKRYIMRSRLEMVPMRRQPVFVDLGDVRRHIRCVSPFRLLLALADFYRFNVSVSSIESWPELNNTWNQHSRTSSTSNSDCLYLQPNASEDRDESAPQSSTDELPSSADREPGPARIIWMPESRHQVSRNHEIQRGRYTIFYPRSQLYGTETNAAGAHYVPVPFNMLTDPRGTTIEGNHGPFTSQVVQAHPAFNSPNDAPVQPSIRGTLIQLPIHVESFARRCAQDTRPGMLDKVKKFFHLKRSEKIN
ncbi:hypothetical protein B7463_g3616, partial [Scytalidium lignicola]